MADSSTIPPDAAAPYSPIIVLRPDGDHPHLATMCGVERASGTEAHLDRGR